MALSQARLREVLDYKPRTGVFRWRVTGSGKGKRKGAIAGTITKRGYRSISIDGTDYYGGPLAFCWMTGAWPKREIDHKNGIRDDDRWINLRPATRAQNEANKGPHRQNRLNLKGVHWDKQTERYRAGITVNYRWIHLGRFASARQAAAAYRTAAIKYFGVFARSR